MMVPDRAKYNVNDQNKDVFGGIKEAPLRLINKAMATVPYTAAIVIEIKGLIPFWLLRLETALPTEKIQAAITINTIPFIVSSWIENVERD